MINQFLGKFLFSGDIEVITALHCGASAAGIEIGGVDNPVIKDPITGQPIIPGSSLKGKLRSITEWSFGLIKEYGDHNGFQAYDCAELASSQPSDTKSEAYHKWHGAMVVGKLYGAATNNDKVRLATGPSRLTVRDSFLNPESATKLESYLGRHTYTELKTENSLDRVTSKANPRPIELVPAGSLFGFNFVIDIYEPADRLLLKEVLAAMHLLENSSLGGSGSRGHGQVCFNNFELQWKSVDNYRTGSSSTQVPIPAAIVNAIEEFDKLQWPI